jgi:hypothetical protein
VNHAAFNRTKFEPSERRCRNRLMQSTTAYDWNSWQPRKRTCMMSALRLHAKYAAAPHSERSLCELPSRVTPRLARLPRN